MKIKNIFSKIMENNNVNVSFRVQLNLVDGKVGVQVAYVYFSLNMNIANSHIAEVREAE